MSFIDFLKKLYPDLTPTQIQVIEAWEKAGCPKTIMSWGIKR